MPGQYQYSPPSRSGPRHVPGAAHQPPSPRHYLPRDTTNGSASYQQASANPAAHTEFVFRKRFERIDWRKIASLDVDRISRELDFASLQENITNITFCSIEAELDSALVDPNFIKLFRLAQLTIEYLLHSQEYLTGDLSNLQDKLQQAGEEHEETKRHLTGQTDQIHEIKKESHKRKKLLAAQQQMIHSGAENYHQCHMCMKAFMNPTFLQNHLQRRHGANFPSQQTNKVIDNQQQENQQLLNTALENELQDIKKRLKLTESQLKHERDSVDSASLKVKNEQEQRDEKLRQEFEVWREEQKESHRTEMDNTRDMFMREIKELSVKNEATQRALSLAQASGSLGKVSNLGTLRDDYDRDEELAKYRQEVSELKEQSQKQIEAESAAWQEQLQITEKKYLAEMKKMRKQHSEELNKNNKALDSLGQSLASSNNEHKEQSQQQIEHFKKQLRDQEKHMRKQQAKMDAMSSRPPAAAPRKPPASPSPEERSQSPAEQSRPHIQPTNKKSHPDIQPTNEQSRPDIQPTNESLLKKSREIPEITDELTSEESDEDKAELSSEEESSEVAVSSLDATAKDDTLRSTLGSTSGDMTLTSNTLRLKKAMVKNPDILRGLKNELTSLLNQNLQTRGIKPDSKGLSDNLFKNKMDLLKQQRRQIAKKLGDFYDIRQRYMNQVNDSAKERLRGSPGVAKQAPKTSVIQASNVNQTSKKKQKLSHQQHPQPAHRVIDSKPKPSTTALPQGSQRTGRVSAPGPKPASRTPSPKKGTLPSTRPDSLEDDDSDISLDPEDMISEEHQKVTSQKMMEVPKEREVKGHELDEESDWDEVLSDSGEDTGFLKESTSKPVSNPKGKMVAQLTQRIESQLSGRGSTTKPVGGVDIMKVDDNRNLSPVTPEIPQMADDDWTDSGDDVSLPPTPPNDHKPRVDQQRPDPGRNNFVDTDSTNTYGTSQWGSTSKAAGHSLPGRNISLNTSDFSAAGGSSVHQSTHGSVGTTKSSLASVTDWDDDLDDL